MSEVDVKYWRYFENFGFFIHFKEKKQGIERKRVIQAVIS